MLLLNKQIMKRLLPILFTFIAVSVFAQQKRSFPNAAIDKVPEQAPFDILKADPVGPANYYLSNSPQVGHTTKQGNSVETFIGVSANPFTGVNGPRTVADYNADLDVMTFLYRQDPASYGNVGNSGWMRYSVSQDGGSTWTENNGLLWDNINSTAANARYPLGMIYNPAGNTVADSARQVFFGPTLNATNGGSWGGLGYGSVKIGDAGATSSDQVELSSGGGVSLYIPNGGTATEGKVWALDLSVDWSSGSGIYQDTISVFEGTAAPGGGPLTFTRTAVPLPVHMDNAPYSEQIAFAPDGQTGYIVCLGRLDSVAYPKRAANLIYMKTLDGGATWSAPEEVYFADDTLITNNIGDSAATDNIASAQFQVDLVVDTFGNPHTIMNIEWRPDNEYGFTFTELPSTIWHVHSPDGGINWDFNRVATTDLRYGGIGDATNSFYMENRPQLTRDANGRYIGMAWFDTDTSLGINSTPCADFSTGYCGNADRFMNSGAYNVVKDYYAPVVEWDIFLQGSYNSNLENIAEIAPTDATGMTIPYVYTKFIDKTSYLSQSDHYYEDGVSYTYEQLGDTATVGLKDRSVDLANVKLFPNPTNGELNIIFEDDMWSSDVKVYNNLGQLVLNSNSSQAVVEGKMIKFNVSSLNEGIYFVRVGENSSQSLRFVKN